MADARCRNIHRLIPLVLAAVLLGTVAPAPAADTSIEKLSKAVCAINCTVPDVGNFIGTGVLVHDSGYVLTSTTVVPPKAENVRCHFLGALNREARVVATDEKFELALLKLDPPDGAQAVAFRDSSDLKVGQTVFTLGDAFVAFARSGRFTVSFGIVSGRYELTEQVALQKVYQGKVLETTATLAAGMDGGPLFDDSGHLVGMLSLNLHPARWLGTAVPSEVLLPRLREVMSADARKHGHQAEPRENGHGRALYPQRVYIDSLFAASAERVAASVVAIDVDRKSDRQTSNRTQRMRRGPQGAYAKILKRPEAMVSGLLIDRRGHVLTSWFNVWGKLKSVHVILPGGQRVEAKVLAHDEYKDLAMLKFNPADLADGVELMPAVFSPLRMHLGYPLATVGRSPNPESHTITTGIVSALGRLDGIAAQIDAAVNYGNAGGPIIDTEGRVIGLVTHVRPDAMWSQNSGVGFAITADSIRDVLRDLENGKSIAKPKRGYIGIQMSSGNVEIRGVVIERVVPGTPADEVGLREKDIITEVDGVGVADAADLNRVVGNRRPGEKVVLTVRRGTQTDKVTVELDEHPYR